jgi:iron complex outermembrane receptor protein
MKLGKSRLFAVAAAHGASLLAVPAVLQAAETAGQIEEIVVTARQRAENIQDVPVSITAFTQADIKAAGIVRPQDFIALTPGVSVVHTAEAGDMQVSIRGINTGRDAEPNFALVIDGVLQTNPNALNQEFSGVTQLEVLKGPQGAVYGRNAVAGALIVTTRKPGDTFDAEVTAGYGTDNSYDASLYLGGPIAGDVRGSISAYTRNTDGQFKNIYLNCSDCVDTFEENGVIGRLLFDVGGGQMDFKAKYSKLSSGAINFNASLALVDAAAYLNTPSFWENPNNHKFEYINNIKPRNDQENVNLSLRGDWDLDFATLTSYIAYNDQKNDFLTDGTSAAFGLYGLNPVCQASNDARMKDQPLPSPFFYLPSSIWYQDNLGSFLPPYSPTTCDGYQYQRRDQSDTSIEVRLTSPGDSSLRWLGGVYYAYINRDVVVSQGADLNQGFTAKAFVPTSGKNPTDLLYNDSFHTDVYSVFGQLAYDVMENFELALALRYDTEKRDVTNNVPVCDASHPTACYAQTPLFNFAQNPYINPAYTATPAYATDGIPNRNKTFSELQPKLSADWKLSDEVSLFASYGFGFRSGGFNSTGSAATISQYYGALTLDDGTPNITDVKDTFKKEVSKAGEVGLKSVLLDRRLSLNAAAFYTDVSDMQYFNFFAGPFGLLRVVTNLDSVTIKGAEFDFHWNVLDSVSIYGGYSFNDSNIDQYKGRPYTKGNKVPYAPDYTGNLGIQWDYPMTGSLKLLARVDGTFVGETWFSPVQKDRLPNLFTGYGFGEGNFSKQKRDPYAVVNVRLGVSGENWSVTGWGKNVGNTDYLQEIIPAPEFGGSFIHQSPGDSYGVDVSYKF